MTTSLGNYAICKLKHLVIMELVWDTNNANTACYSEECAIEVVRAEALRRYNEHLK